MELKQNITSYAEQVKEIYKKHYQTTEATYEYQLFQNWDLSKSFGCFDNNKLVGFIAVSDKSIMNDTNGWRAALIENPMFIDSSYETHSSAFIKYTVDNLCVFYDTVCIYSKDWSKVSTDLELENALVVNEVEFVKGEYPTPMLMTWNEPTQGVIASIETASAEGRMACERTLAQIDLDIRLRQRSNQTYMANPFAYAWYDEASKQIKCLTYIETAQAIWLLNLIQPNGSFYMYANYDFNEIPQVKVLNKDIVLVKCFKKSARVVNNVKFLDLY